MKNLGSINGVQMMAGEARQAAAAPRQAQRSNGQDTTTTIPPSLIETPAPVETPATPADVPTITAAPVDVKTIPGGRWNGLPDENGNRINPAGLFKTITFKAASPSAKVYKDAESGRAQKKKAGVLLFIGETGGALKGSVRLVQNKGEGKPHLEFGLFGAKNQGVCLAIEGAQAEAEFDQMKKVVLRTYVAWEKKNRAEVAAFNEAEIALEGAGSLYAEDDTE